MAELAAILLVVGALAVVLSLLSWLASRVRRRGVGGDVMGPLDEIWHPAAHRFRAEIEVHEERVLPLPAPGDRPHRP
ncbi:MULTISPECIES: hypothetical protein [Micromonospora]|uniref:Secreted protein n=1 Tax=Micromonospora solifontis TaxID=2487138 RepID=A0ABX9WG61_9ACTN|nr:MULTISPECIES: hypothetical protein [Micromonospora]NES16826.1 hypothetical protein [Micromonospora sp. PPF5-17B]NES37844.1 hypothetical protein [Micromonospora solifontis]NES58536.1 hypothetical protein [Micromonospora sp. PPF5-6]RNL97939.1 hypothetical protein EFE23_17055 [Micromonospora solifontis]